MSMMSTRAMHVPVRQLLLGRIAYSDDLDVEVQVLARQRMVAVNGYHVTGDGCDGHRARALVGLRMQPHSDSNLCNPLQGAARHLLDELPAVLAIAIGRRDFHRQLVTGALSFQLALESGHEIAMPLQVGEGLAVRGGVGELA